MATARKAVDPKRSAAAKKAAATRKANAAKKKAAPPPPKPKRTLPVKGTVRNAKSIEILNDSIRTAYSQIHRIQKAPKGTYGQTPEIDRRARAEAVRSLRGVIKGWREIVARLSR